MSQVLIVDDEPAICWAFQEALSDAGHRVHVCASAEDALDWTDNASPDLVLLDVRLPGIDGLTALQKLQGRLGDAPIIIMTAFGNLDTAVRAIDGGAFDYLPKPFDLDQAMSVIRQALDSRENDLSIDQPKRAASHTDQLIVGSSPAMQAVFRQIALVADRDVPVLITGESGTGKELISLAIHQHSSRSNGPFVPICIPAMSENLVESELFGHVRGAFTGADADRRGLLELATGGTALLDEIGDVTSALQVKLLRAIEHKTVFPVGSTQPRTSDFRLIAATNQPLEELVAKGVFREDLFYRLNVFRINVPPLRERTEDIPSLAIHFLAQVAGDNSVRFAEETLDELRSRHWSGNVRELRNVVEHAAILARSQVITPDCLPAPPKRPASDTRTSRSRLAAETKSWAAEQLAESNARRSSVKLYEDFLATVEPELLRAVLSAAGGNRGAAARLLGIHRETLRQKLRNYDLD